MRAISFLLSVGLLGACSDNPDGSKNGDAVINDNFQGNRFALNLETTKDVPLVRSVCADIDDTNETCARRAYSEPLPECVQGDQRLIRHSPSSRKLLNLFSDVWDWQKCPMTFFDIAQSRGSSSRVSNFSDAFVEKGTPILQHLCTDTHIPAFADITTIEQCSPAILRANGIQESLIPAEDLSSYRIFYQIAGARSLPTNGITLSLGNNWDPDKTYELDVSVWFKIVNRLSSSETGRLNFVDPKDTVRWWQEKMALLPNHEYQNLLSIKRATKTILPVAQAIVHCAKNEARIESFDLVHTWGPDSPSVSLFDAVNTPRAIAENGHSEVSFKNVKPGETCQGSDVLLTIIHKPIANSNPPLNFRYFEPTRIQVERE